MYTLRGWRVFQAHGIRDDGSCTCLRGQECACPGKHPATAHGLNDATDDLAQIENWWRARPLANVAVATGAASGCFVLDIDGDVGAASLRELEAVHGPLPATRESFTGKGRHLWFRHPSGHVPSRTGLRPGIDIRGDGGYVVAAPSRHVSGARYRWHDTEPLADAPEWLLALVRGADPGPANKKSGDGSGGATGASQLKNSDPEDAKRLLTPVAARAALTAEAELVRQAQPGSRNAALNRAAFKIGQLVGAELIERDEAAAVLSEAARECGLGDAEIASTLRSGLGAGETQPRTNATESGRGLFRLSELLRRPPPKWVVRGMIPEGALGFLVGEAGAGKSATAIYLALKVTNGEDFFGHATQRREVVYIATDDPKFTPLRISAAMQAYGIEKTRDDISVWEIPVDLGKSGDVQRLTREARALGIERPLFIVDTQAESMSGDENNPKDMGAFIRGCRALIAAFPGSAVVVIAHPGWTNKDRTRGHYSAHGAADFEWFLYRVEKHPGWIEIKSGKSRNAPPFETIYARLEQVKFTPRPGFEADDPETLITIAPGDGSEPEQPTHEDYAKQRAARGKGEPSRHRKAHALKVLRDAGRTGLGLNEWERKSGIPKATLRGWAKAWMENDGCPVAQRDGRYIAAESARDGD